MEFKQLMLTRQSTRAYAADKAVEAEKLQAVLEAGRLAPSASNGQPWHAYVAGGETAKSWLPFMTNDKGANRFLNDVPVLIALTHDCEGKVVDVNGVQCILDYRTFDVGGMCAYMTLRASDLGLGTCIIGYMDAAAFGKHLNLPEGEVVDIVIALGYPAEGDPIRDKKRKEFDEVVKYL